MQEYWSYKGALLNRYEWAGGINTKNSKQTRKEQASRKREVEKGFARVVDETEWLNL